MKLIPYICLFLIFSLSASSNDIQLMLKDEAFCYDGDTCYVMFAGKNDKIRLLELDTPEISKPKCDAELELAIKARDFLNDLIKNAEFIEFKTDYERDYFGRILTYLIIDGKDVSTLLVKNDLGVVYKKGHKMDWCAS